MTDQPAKIRVDKWLWYARFFKTRSLAAKVVSGGHVRVNGQKIAKSSHAVGPEDVLTFPQAKEIRVVRISALGTRRGPAPEAQALYTDLTERKEKQPRAPKYEGKGRPSKRDRRSLDNMKTSRLED
ncbi:RNA-binding S4 domain-containing protein [Cognatishimia activa]|uniref:Heat shock protein 15 n=1 Tax=Cognatishimia activa TaxID=1715691 RepID=A0A0P1IL00_9RHOB|nr:RNA-binding S4 domain-containing protein [Cognatishimia activa]MEE2945277.1 RNA-binding S4 domain-containing protein [Pseudomonadota bacterium]CUI28639.1 Heat shock protein 15 [Cognatishimia activa]CUK24281.1 Heat shock protein 15 [Cognatishimia activa]